MKQEPERTAPNLEIAPYVASFTRPLSHGLTLRNVANELAVAGRNGGGTPEAYHGAVEHALAGLEPFKADIETSIQMQEPLLEQIFAENERWVGMQGSLAWPTTRVPPTKSGD